jgi:hypothetical protein
MSTSFPCAVCGEPVSPDADRVEVEAELVPPDEQSKTYWLHPRCWSRLSAGWDEVA